MQNNEIVNKEQCINSKSRENNAIEFLLKIRDVKDHIVKVLNTYQSSFK